MQYFFSKQDLSHQNPIDFAFSYFETVKNLAVVPISGFQVAAAVIDDLGNLYFGFNQESAFSVMGQTVHAEQSAIAHAFMRGARKITDVIVNYTPCGHCRQFLNELRGAEDLEIHLPHSRNNPLKIYLPDSFSPADLGMEKRLLDEMNNGLNLQGKNKLHEEALRCANRSYAPYTKNYAGVALLTHDGEIYGGAYLENVAYNPTLPPLQVALNQLRLAGKNTQQVQEALLVCHQKSGHDLHSQALWAGLSEIELKVEYLD